MASLDPDVRAYYERGAEAARLCDPSSPSGPLELVRTRELLGRHLPPPPADVVDVGGGPGVHAAWLAGQGHRVRLVDPVALHVEQARAADPRIHAQVGDARALPRPDRSADVVLLLGPLYHLVERDDRRTALVEIRRVLRPGGLLCAAAISRFAALLDLLVRLDRLHEPGVLAVVEDAVRSGVFRGPRAGLFTTAYFHRPAELGAEIADAGFAEVRVLPVEGPGFLVSEFADRWADPGRRDVLLRAARLLEADPDAAPVTGHLLAVARLDG